MPLDYANTDFSVSLDDENRVSISYDDCDYVNFEINYCPMCGRKLIEDKEVI